MARPVPLYHRAAACVLILLVVALAGCTNPFRPTGEDNGSTDTPGPTSPPPDGTTPTEGASPPRVAPPTEQFEERPEDIDREGEYALLERRTPHSEATWSVPAWPIDATWRYRHHVPTAPGTIACDPETADKVLARANAWEIEVYRIERAQYDCSSDEVASTERFNHTVLDILQLDDDGYIEHAYFFPLEDGKRWRFMRLNGVLVDVEATHEPGYLWSGGVAEAWLVEQVFPGQGDVHIKQWVGVDARNLLRKEVWAEDESGVPLLVFTSELVSYSGV